MEQKSKPYRTATANTIRRLLWEGRLDVLLRMAHVLLCWHRRTGTDNDTYTCAAWHACICAANMLGSVSDDACMWRNMYFQYLEALESIAAERRPARYQIN